MQSKFGYEPDPPLGGNLAICSNQIASRFDCLGVTLEMPFKDCAANLAAPDSVGTYQGERCAALGASLLDALAYVAPGLRGTDRPKFNDAYITPIEDAKEVDAFVAAAKRAREDASATSAKRAKV